MAIKNKSKKPEIEITDDMISKIESLAASGLIQEEIARAIGIARSTFYKKKKNDERITEAILDGKAKGLAKVANKLFQKAMDGDTVSIIYYLKQRGLQKEWNKIPERDNEHDHPKQNIVFNITGQVTEEK